MHGPHGLSLICAYIPCSNILTLLSFALKKALRHWTHLWHEHYLQHHRKACRLASFPWLSLQDSEFGFKRAQGYDSAKTLWFQSNISLDQLLSSERSAQKKQRNAWENESMNLHIMAAKTALQPRTINQRIFTSGTLSSIHLILSDTTADKIRSCARVYIIMISIIIIS